MAIARCIYCGSTLEPNSMYCLACGQLVSSTPTEAVETAGWAHEDRPRRAPVPAPQAPQIPQPLSDNRAPAPVDTGQPPAPVVAPAARNETWPERVLLTFSTGESVAVAGEAVIGRKPEQTAANLGAQAVEISDDTRSVSRVHLYFGLAEGELRVADAGSSNGSSIGRDERMIPLIGGGERQRVHPGDVIWVGDVRLDVSAA